MIPHYALSSLFASIAIVGLGVISLIYRNRDRIRIRFALFCFAWSLIPFSSFGLQLGIEAPIPLERVSPATAFLASFFAMLYVLGLAGRRLDDPIGPVRGRTYVAACAAKALLGAGITLATPWVVAGKAYHPWAGYSPIFARTAPAIQIPLGALTLVWVVILIKAIRGTQETVDRIFLKRNLGAIITILASSGLLAVVLPTLGVPSFSILFDTFALVAFYFYAIIANHQFERFEELHRSLDQRVAERTAELRKAQIRLIQAEKMASLGALVAGVAHEMNTPLGAVRSMHDTRARAANKLEIRIAELFGVEVWQDKHLERVRTVIHQGDQVISEGIDRIVRIVGELKSFARLDQADLETVELHSMIEETLALMNTQLSQVELLKRYCPPFDITCVPRQFNQVLFNVLSNSVEAMKGTGKLGIFTEKDGDYAVIRVVDDGCGIQPEHVAKVFDPGFTTKGTGVGTGLGLAISYQILHEHGGDISVESAPSVGTKVKLRLPIEGRLIVRSGSSPVASASPVRA